MPYAASKTMESCAHPLSASVAPSTAIVGVQQTTVALDASQDRALIRQTVDAAHSMGGRFVRLLLALAALSMATVAIRATTAKRGANQDLARQLPDIRQMGRAAHNMEALSAQQTSGAAAHNMATVATPLLTVVRDVSQGLVVRTAREQLHMLVSTSPAVILAWTMM